jgi:type I restriction enzyme S subunit
MNSYGSYKSTRIDWVGEIPFHWEVIQPKYKLRRVTRPTEEDDDVITCFRDGVVTLRKNRRDDGFTESLKEHGYQQIRPGDLVVHEMDGFAGAIGISDSKGKSTPVYTVIEPDGRTDLNYVAYLLREMSRSGKIQSLARSIRERTTDFRWNTWSTIHFAFPPLKEQHLISRYLDNKTTQINSLIEKIKKKIELLKQQRTSLINQCVTKGLDPNVEMKDSGVDWIGKIPKHWELKRLSALYSESSIRGHENEESLSVFRDYGVVRRVDYENKNVLSDDLSAYKLVKTNDLVLNKMKTWMGSLGISDFRGIVSPAYHVFTPTVEMFSGYFHHLLRSTLYINQYASRSKGVRPGQWDLSVDEFKSLYAILPPLNEQKSIWNFLQSSLRTSTRVEECENTRIELLKEYRQSLISSVVTGKIRITEDMV